MEFEIYLLILISSLGLGVLSIRDRIFGILGTIIGWLGGLYLLNDGTLVITRVYDANSTSWLGYSIPFQQVELAAIILALFGIADIFIVLAMS
jgi:hypothetical protein